MEQPPNHQCVCMPLMCVDVMAILEPAHQATLRSAGRSGLDVYEEVVAQGRAELHLETTHTTIHIDSGDATSSIIPRTHVPLSLDPAKPLHPDGLRTDDVLVVTPASLARRNHNSKGWKDVCHIKFYGFQTVTMKRLSECFLAGCASLKEVELTTTFGKTGILPINEFFLYGCMSLRYFDISPLQHITNLDHRFMAGCSSLEVIDLSPLYHINTIGVDCLKGCTSLKNVILCSLDAVDSIGMFFLSGCTSLRSIRSHRISTEGGGINAKSSSSGQQVNKGSVSLSNGVTTTIGMYFLSDCTSLPSVDLSSFSKVTTIGSFFMENCTSLESIDFTPFVNVADVAPGFMRGCTSLKTIVNIEGPVQDALIATKNTRSEYCSIQ